MDSYHDFLLALGSSSSTEKQAVTPLPGGSFLSATACSKEESILMVSSLILLIIWKIYQRKQWNSSLLSSDNLKLFWILYPLFPVEEPQSNVLKGDTLTENISQVFPSTYMLESFGSWQYPKVLVQEFPASVPAFRSRIKFVTPVVPLPAKTVLS